MNQKSNEDNLHEAFRPLTKFVAERFKERPIAEKVLEIKNLTEKRNDVLEGNKEQVEEGRNLDFKIFIERRKLLQKMFGPATTR